MVSLIKLLVGAGVALALTDSIRSTSLTTNSRQTGHESVIPKMAYAPVAVLELFTSQGCSSCPSADQLLTETLSEATKTNKNVIGLSFHVDYWDRLGWNDVFSQHTFTLRQYQYGTHFAQQGVYTPQVVMNGQQEYVGSNRAKQNSALETALSQPATVAVQLSVATSQTDKLVVSYQLDGELTNAVINVALVSKTTETSVPRGENAGHKLSSNNVVRVFQTLPASHQGRITLSVPPDFKRENGALVAYVQNKTSLAIQGARVVNLMAL